MATRVNRAATASSKKGGRRGRKNHTVGLFDTHKKLDSPKNQMAFEKHSQETEARIHNATTASKTDPHALGTPEGRDYTPSRPGRGRKWNEHLDSHFHLRSPVLNQHGELPIEYTGEGGNLSPPISWSGAPSRAEEFALICEEMGAESNVFWLVYRIPSSVKSLPRGIPQGEQVESLPGGPLQGRNSMGILGYTGPLPPPFESWHHYVFKLYALEVPLRDLRPGMTKEEVLERVGDHILEQTEMTVRCRRQLPMRRVG